jgi:hypothetical protein
LLSQLLIPIGAAVLIAAFVAALILTARSQRAAKGMAFREFAAEAGYAYLPEDDGQAEVLSEGFQGFAQFDSPALGHVAPRDVIRAQHSEGHVVAFHHGTRVCENQGREWFVCNVRLAGNVGTSLAIVPLGGPAVPRWPGFNRLELPEEPRLSRAFEVWVESDDGRQVLKRTVCEYIASCVETLAFRPEVQIREDRVSAYPANPNYDVTTKEELRQLVEFTRGLARRLQLG